MVRLCDIVDIKSAFMEKTDLSEEEIQTIIDEIPTAYDVDGVVAQLKDWTFTADIKMPDGTVMKNRDLISSKNAVDIVGTFVVGS